jgi:hypothetical protein
MKRMRKAVVTDPVTGELVPFPYMPCPAVLPPRWRHFSTADKIERLIGLDRAIAILSWGPIDKLDPLRRLYQVQVIRIMLSIAGKAMVQGKLDRELARERGRQEAIERFRKAMAATAISTTGNASTGKSSANRGGSLEKLGRTRKLRPIFTAALPMLSAARPTRCGLCSSGVRSGAIPANRGSERATRSLGGAGPRSELPAWQLHPR